MSDRQLLGGGEQAVGPGVAVGEERLGVAAVVVDEVARQWHLDAGFLPWFAGLVLHQPRQGVRVRQQPVSQPHEMTDTCLDPVGIPAGLGSAQGTNQLREVAGCSLRNLADDLP